MTAARAWELAPHVVAIALLVGFAALFGLAVSEAWGDVLGAIAGGLLGASMVMRYIGRTLENS